jgi:hypothetical protein
MFPVISFLTGVKATLPRRSNSVVVASAASRNSLVAMPWSLGSIGTSLKDRLCMSNQVCPGGMGLVVADMAARKRLNGVGWERGGGPKGRWQGRSRGHAECVNRVRSRRVVRCAVAQTDIPASQDFHSNCGGLPGQARHASAAHATGAGFTSHFTLVSPVLLVKDGH